MILSQRVNVTNRFIDIDGLRKSSEESANWGFTGRQVIHPSHVPIVQAAYSPSESRIVWATELVKAFDAHQQLGKVVKSLSVHANPISLFFTKYKCLLFFSGSICL